MTRGYGSFVGNLTWGPLMNQIMYSIQRDAEKEEQREEEKSQEQARKLAEIEERARKNPNIVYHVNISI